MRLFAPLVLLAACDPSSSSSTDLANRNAGDVNGDGLGDAIIGDPTWDGDRGRALVSYGTRDGLSPEPAAILEGIDPGDRFGFAVAGAGDVNADGFSDVIVGAPLYGAEYAYGAASVFLGSPDGLRTTPVEMWIGDHIGARFGTVVSGGTDRDADGFDDVLVDGAWLFTGSPSGPSPIPAGDRLDASMATLADGVADSDSAAESHPGAHGDL